MWSRPRRSGIPWALSSRSRCPSVVMLVTHQPLYRVRTSAWPPVAGSVTSRCEGTMRSTPPPASIQPCVPVSVAVCRPCRTSRLNLRCREWWLFVSAWSRMPFGSVLTVSQSTLWLKGRLAPCRGVRRRWCGTRSRPPPRCLSTSRAPPPLSIWPRRATSAPRCRRRGRGCRGCFPPQRGAGAEIGKGIFSSWSWS